MGDLNQHNLQEYIDKHECEAFVETGTGIGDGFNYALSFKFSYYFTAEINEELYKRAVNKIEVAHGKNRPDIFMSNLNSMDGIKKALETTGVTTLFWLDAHFPGADFNLASYSDDCPKDLKYPLKSELETILKKRPNNKDVFIIDDLQLYEKGKYQLNADEEFLKEHKQVLDFEEVLGKTHTLKRDFRHQGFLIAEPKKENNAFNSTNIQ